MTTDDVVLLSAPSPGVRLITLQEGDAVASAAPLAPAASAEVDVPAGAVGPAPDDGDAGDSGGDSGDGDSGGGDPGGVGGSDGGEDGAP